MSMVAGCLPCRSAIPGRPSPDIRLLHQAVPMCEWTGRGPAKTDAARDPDRGVGLSCLQAGPVHESRDGVAGR